MNSATSTDPGLRPWQLFLLAGMLAATAVVLVSTGQTMSSVVVLSATVVASSLVAVAGYRSLAPLAAASLFVDADASVTSAMSSMNWMYMFLFETKTLMRGRSDVPWTFLRRRR